MPVYEYRGVGSNGRAVRGVLDADNPRDLKDALRRQGIFLSEYKSMEGGGAEAGEAPRRPGGQKGGMTHAAEAHGKGGGFRLGKRVKVMELAEVTRQLSTLLKAAIPVVDCITAVSKQSSNVNLQRVLNEIRRAVTEGKSLGNALADHPAVFNDLYVNMVRAGESSGTLDIVFSRLADFTEAQAKLRSRLIGAMTYPLVMMGVGVIIVSLMMMFVVPKLTAMFTDMGQKLPALTRGLIWISEYFQDWWHATAAGIVFAIWSFNKYRTSESGRARWDSFVLRIPLFGQLMRMVAITRFSRTLGTLLKSGVPIITALEIVKHVVGNKVLEEVLEEAKLAVKEGDSLARPLERSGQFPPMVVHMIAVGEQSGQVEEMLDNVSSAYEMQVDSKLTVLTSLLEPLMILCMGVAVALIVFAILTPMLQMNELLKG
ncbi:MAG: type II secretion system protein GspF [Deltaproteobacteria bacterium]|nr:type II secretion system protein GspF [Deltaproteobacteria bacterium]